jgi:hypothetical protein
MVQKKKVGRPAAKKVAAVTEKMIPKPVVAETNQFPEVDKIETIEVERPPKQEKIPPKEMKLIKKRRNLHPVEINGKVRLLTKFAYNVVRKNQNLEIILPKNSPFNELDDCVGC